MSTTTMKPDYFIAHNGLPNIILKRGRRLITQTTTSTTITTESDRVLGNQQQIHPLPTKNNRNLNQQARVMQRDSENNVRNRAIKESLRSTKSSKDLINAQIVKNGSSWNKRSQQTPLLSASKCANTDNSTDCNRNFKR